MAVSNAQKKAKEKYEKDAYDKVLVRLPKGTKERIQATGSTLNNFAVSAILEKLKTFEIN